MTVSFVAVLPAIAHDLTRDCVRTMSPILRERLVVIDNTAERNGLGRLPYQPWHQLRFNGGNIGVARSWNVGLEKMRAEDAEYLIIVSQSIAFGVPGGTELLDEIERRHPRTIIHAQHGWHYLAIHADVFIKVGDFDPVFTPAYYEESDFLRRMHLAGLPCPLYNDGKYDQIVVDVSFAGDGAALRRKLVRVNYGAQTRKYIAKHGGTPTFESFATPYNRPHLDWFYTGDPPD